MKMEKKNSLKTSAHCILQFLWSRGGKIKKKNAFLYAISTKNYCNF
jgi:hypothetical protein